MASDYLAILVQVLLACGFAAAVLVLSVVCGRAARRDAGAKDSPYECGMKPVGPGAPRFPVKFYLVAMLFVVFDLEVVFMYPWAIEFRDLVRAGGAALPAMTGFAGILGVAYVYALRKGALHWR